MAQRIGYARVSTEDQTTDLQLAALRKADCDEIFEDRVSGTIWRRPGLDQALEVLEPGGELIVWKLDRLGRNMVQLVNLVLDLDRRDIGFRSLTEALDTKSALGRGVLALMAAFAENEREVISERTRAGLAVARKQGKVGGNPGLRRRDPVARARVSEARSKAYTDQLQRSAEQWLPIVRRLRPKHPWETVVRAVNRSLGPDASWTLERLKRAIRRFVADGLAEPELLASAPRRPVGEAALTAVASMYRRDPTMTFGVAARELEQMRIPTARGGQRWAISSVAKLLARAKRVGLLSD